MRASYLRVKKWKDWQHYKDREPPWVKLHSKLLRDDLFNELGEFEQWQLVRIWMVASQSSRFTLDEEGRLVPVVTHDEQALRRSIQTLKKVPIERFVREGWLIPVAEDELVDPPFKGKPGDSTVLATAALQDPHGASALLAVEKQRVRSSEKHLKAVTADQEIEHEIDKLMRCLKKADDGSRGVITSIARKLPVSRVAKVRESCQGRVVGAGYAVRALQAELADLEEVA